MNVGRTGAKYARLHERFALQPRLWIGHDTLRKVQLTVSTVVMADTFVCLQMHLTVWRITIYP